jgi:hypothetical protein
VVVVVVLAVAVGGCAVVLWPRDDGLTREEAASQRACDTYRDLREDGDRLYGGEFDNALRLIREEAHRSDSPALLEASGRLDASLWFTPLDRRGIREALAAMDEACRDEGVVVSG